MLAYKGYLAPSCTIDQYHFQLHKNGNVSVQIRKFLYLGYVSMMEHSRFIASLLDASERNLVLTARKFGEDFEILLNQARDVESMLYHKEPTYPIIGKLNKDSENAASELRDFKKAGLELIKTCQIRNVINPLPVDHVVREAEHFLYMIHVLEDRLKKKQSENA